MAKKRNNIEVNRQFIAMLVANQELTLTKPLRDYTDTYVNRIANDMRSQMQRGLTPSRQPARGHRLTEHGRPSGFSKGEQAPLYKRPARPSPAPPQIPVPRPIRGANDRVLARAATLNKVTVKRLAKGDLIVTSRNDKQTLQMVDVLGRVEPQRKVYVAWVDTHGGAHNFYAHGVRARDLRLAAYRHGGWFNLMMEIYKQRYGDEEPDILDFWEVELQVG